MSRRVDQVKNILFSVFCLVHDTDRLSFDRDPPLPFQFHIIQYLRLHLPLRQKPRLLYDPVCQSGFTVIDVGDDTKVPNIFFIDS